MLRLVPVLLFLLTVAPAAERREPASASELAEITKRGRLLAEYDQAAWRATDALQLLKPDRGTLGRYVAKKTDAGWTVAFGRLSSERNRFLIAYEAEGTHTAGSGAANEFTVTRYDPPKEDVGFYFHAARGIEVALAEFTGQDRPYNAAVLRSESGDLFVYVVPAQTKAGVFPLGGDARYRMTADGSRILEKRQLHVAIIEIPGDPKVKVEAGYHSAVLDDVPEDTDVFHVLTRRPAMPEWIGTKKYVYLIQVDGSIKYVMPMEAFRKVGRK